MLQVMIEMEYLSPVSMTSRAEASGYSGNTMILNVNHNRLLDDSEKRTTTHDGQDKRYVTV